jgi:hypothetical protein
VSQIHGLFAMSNITFHLKRKIIHFEAYSQHKERKMAQNFPKAQVEKKETCEPNNKKTIAKVD